MRIIQEHLAAGQGSALETQNHPIVYFLLLQEHQRKAQDPLEDNQTTCPPPHWKIERKGLILLNSNIIKQCCKYDNGRSN